MRSLTPLLACVLVLGCGKVVEQTPPDAEGDPCETATCECTTASEDTDCGEHQFCDVTTGPGRTCACVAGYTNGVTGCVFTGAVQDPGFESATTWTPVKGALLNTTAVGSVDPGEANFLASSLCSLGVVEQTVEMPSFRKAEPLVVELSYKNQFDFGNFDSVLTGVSFGGTGWFSLRNFNDANFHSVRICLGGGGYAPDDTVGKGAPVTFRLGPYQQPDRCPNSTITNFAFDHFNIVPANAGECGVVLGEGPNFDAESTGGWTFTTSGSSVGAFVAGIGANGTKAARVTLGARCDQATMDTTFIVPSIGNPALEMFVGTGAGVTATMSIGGFISTPPLPSGGTTNLHMCLPPSLRGQTAGITFNVNGGSGSCATILNHAVFADNIRVVDDPACASTEGISDPGFEQPNLPLGSFAFHGSSTADVFIRNDATNAHGGTRFLSIESNGRCSGSGYTMIPIVPPASGASGPALKFFAKVGVNPDASTSVSAFGTATQTLTEGVGYVQYTVCLNPIFIGQPQIVRISHSGGSGLCDNSNYVVQTAFIDDVEVTTDASCPAQ